MQPPWRALLAELNDKELNVTIRQRVLDRIAPDKELMESHRGHVSGVRDAARSRIHMEPCSARAVIEDAFRAIEKNMLDVVP